MNPLTNMKNVLKLSEQELRRSNKTSWHDQYRDSAWVFIGGLPFDLTEGDIVCIFSQYGEPVNINLIRDKDSGKSKGFCFLCYEDQRSTDLVVDNLNGIKILNRTIRVDHVSNYRVPKQGKNTDAETKKLYDEGCAPKAVPVQIAPVVPVKPSPFDVRETLADQINSEIKLPARLPIYTVKKEPIDEDEQVPVKKDKKPKKEKKKRKKSKKNDSSGSSDETSSDEISKRKKSKKKKRTKHSSSSDESDSEKDVKRRRNSADETKSTSYRDRYKAKEDSYVRSSDHKNSRNREGYR